MTPNDPFDPEYWNTKRDLQAAGALENDARLDRWSGMTRKTRKLTDEERQISIENFLRFVEHMPEMTKGRLAKLAGIGSSTLSELLKGQYRGDVDRLIGRLDAAINEFYRRRDAPGRGQFVHTNIAKRIFTILKTTAKLEGMGAFYCASGVGKTIALEAAIQQDFPSAILVKVTPGCASPLNFSRELLKQIMRPRGVPDAIRTQAGAFNQIVARLEGSQRLILIDEADGLHIETFNTVRHIHDATGCPIVLAGRPNLARKIDRTTRNDEIGGSLRGRLCVEHDLMAGFDGRTAGRWLFSVGEVSEILAKFKIRFAKDAAHWLTMLANLSAYDGQRESGGLRYAVKIFTLAILLVRQKADATISLEMVRIANAYTRDEEYAAQIGLQVDAALRKCMAG